MKKTIAKIMAAALVLSSFTVPNVSASNLVNNTGTTLWTPSTFVGYNVSGSDYVKHVVKCATQDDTLDVNFDGDSYIVDGAFVENAVSDPDFTWTLDSDGIANLAEYGDYTDVLYELDVKDDVDATIQVAPEYVDQSSTPYQIDELSNATTPTAARTDVAEFDEDTTEDILDHFSVSKSDIVYGYKSKDVTVARSLDGTDLFIENWELNANGVWVRNIWLNRTVDNYATRVELARQISTANYVIVPRKVCVNGRYIGQRWFELATTASVVNDDYWNAIVKLKADRNRYTPIRVHVDVVDGSLKGLTGLYVQVVNGTVVPWGYRTYGTDAILTTQVANNRLVINDVQDNDLLLLKSDVAKGKRLMLDEAYMFNVTGLANNNSLTGAGDAVFDYSFLGEDIDWDTISVGKIQDIRSRIFKECKEKEVHAENLKWVRNGSFRKNKMMKKAILSDKVSMKKINEKAFYDCKRLKAVKVKVNSLKQVGKNAFGGSTDKKSLKFNLKAGSKAKFNKAVKLFKKSGVKKAHFKKI
jgi:predicted RNase H-related nuclease YkuK (DUF458 family)